MNIGATDKAFTQNWLQSLTLAASDPIAKKIKPLLETVNALSRMNSDSDRLQSAQQLWEFASQHELLGLLAISPLLQARWTFDRDDIFAYRRESREELNGFDQWLGWLGINECDIPLQADVANADWLSLVRKEAVRLQRSMNTGAMPQGLNLDLACTAHWTGAKWSMRFSQAEWVQVEYEEPFTADRPDFATIEETLYLAMSFANDQLIPKKSPVCDFPEETMPWMDCVPRLTSLHGNILLREARQYSPWFRRTWACVWTAVYREQNVLRGKAEIDPIRREMAACISHVPQLVMWMFLFAKLTCECQMGRGLGIAGDFA